MFSLTSLVAAHGTVLLIDSSSSRVQAGLWRPDMTPVWHESEHEAGVAVFQCIENLLVEVKITLGDVGAWVFCRGPGSILGIRTAAMALRTWQTGARSPTPVLAYSSLELQAHALLASGTKAPFAVIADARRKNWHWVEVKSDRKVQALRRVPVEVLANWDGDLFMPAGFRTWGNLPAAIRTTPYELDALWGRVQAVELLETTLQPDAFLHEEPAYAVWTPQIHRAALDPLI